MSDLIKVDSENSVPIKKKYIIRQIWISGLANLLQAVKGFVLATSSIMVPQLLNPTDENELSLNENEATWFASFYCVGYLSGSFIGAFQGYHFGQRISLIIECCTATAGLLVVGFAPTLEYLLIGRFLCGHASASSTVTIPLFTSEISMPKVRGLTGSFLLNFYLVGYCLTVFLGSIIHWRYTMISLVIFPIFSGICLFFAPNSPIWLVEKGRDEEAFNSLMYFRGDALQVQKEMDEIKSNISINKLNDENKESSSIKACFIHKLKRFQTPEFWKPLLICIVLTPGFVEWNGLGSIAFYMVTFVEKTGIPLDPYLAACVNTVGRAFFGIVSARWIAKYPRRSVYLTCIALMMSGTGIIAVYHYFFSNDFFSQLDPSVTNIVFWIPAIGYFLTSFSYSSGYVQISYMTQGELFPADLKSFGCGIIVFLDGISMFLSIKSALFFLNTLGVTYYFVWSTIMIACTFVFAFFCMPEARGKTLQQIENEFKK